MAQRRKMTRSDNTQKTNLKVEQEADKFLTGRENEMQDRITQMQSTIDALKHQVTTLTDNQEAQVPYETPYEAPKGMTMLTPEQLVIANKRFEEEQARIQRSLYHPKEL